MQEDLHYWETVAYVWIYDTPTVEARLAAWLRFLMAYPEHAHETCEDFWKRICGSRWHKKHHHHYKKHHHHYGHGDHDDCCDDE